MKTTNRPSLNHLLYFECLEDRTLLSSWTGDNSLALSDFLASSAGNTSYIVGALQSASGKITYSAIAAQNVMPNYEPGANLASLAAASIYITGPNGNVISIGSTVDFGIGIQGEIGPQLTFSVENEGTITLWIGSLTLPTGFQLLEGLPASLGPGVHDTFTVGLNTTTTGTYSGLLTLITSDTAASPFTFTIKGIVTANAGPEIDLTTTNGLALPSGTTVNFGSVVRDSAGPLRTFMIRNVGTSVLTLGAMSLPSGFRVVEGLATSLAPGVYDALTIGLDTSIVGVKSGVLRLTNNDTNESPYVLNLTGTVTANVTSSVGVLDSDGNVVQSGNLVEFDSVGQGGIATPIVYQVVNYGTTTLTLGTVTVPNGFRLVDPLVTSLLPGRSDTFSVRLDTSYGGLKSGTLRFTTNDPNNNPFTLSLTGLVTTPAPEILVTTASGTEITLGETVDFGDSVQGASGAQLSFVVRNTGGTWLTLGRLTLPSGFRLVEGLPSSLWIGASNSFTIALDTTTAGAKSGVLLLENNDANESPYRISLAGRVLPAGPEIAVTSSYGQDIPIGGIIDFGSALRGATAPQQTITVTNLGTSALTLGSIALPVGFRLVKSLPPSVAPGASAVFTVELSTSTVATRTGVLSFFTNDSNENLYRITLTGQVTPAAPTVQVATAAGATIAVGDTLDFGSVFRGHTGPQLTFVVTNTGTATMTLGPVTLPAGYRLVNGLIGSLRPGASDTVTVQLLSTVVGTTTGSLSFATNVPGVNPFQFVLTGKVLADAAEIEVTTSTGSDIPMGTMIDFGSVTRNQAVQKTFIVRNVGSRVLTLGAISLPTGFRLITTMPSSLAAGASTTFAVQLQSSAVGTKTGILRFTNNDADESPYTFTIQGLVT